MKACWASAVACSALLLMSCEKSHAPAPSSNAATAPVAPFEYKGVPLGASEKTFTAVHPGFECALADMGGDRSCSMKGGTYGGAPVRFTTADFVGDKLYRVHIVIEFVNAPAVSDALREALGSPTTNEVRPLAATEASKNNYVWTWARGPQRVRYQSYEWGNPATMHIFSGVTIETDSYKDDLARADADRKKRRAKDL